MSLNRLLPMIHMLRTEQDLTYSWMLPQTRSRDPNTPQTEVNLNFQRELLSLQDLATIAIASQLWQLPDMRLAVEETLDVHYPHWRNCNSSINLNRSCLEELSAKISNLALQKFNRKLPEAVKAEIKNRVLEMLEDVLHWTLYLIHVLELDYKVTEQIYWTSYGLIDEDEIFRNFWAKHLAEEPVKWKKFDKNLNLLQYLACLFGQEEYILLHQRDYIRVIKSDTPLETENNYDIVFTIMKIVISYYNDYILQSQPVQEVEFHTITKSTTEMLDICAYRFFYKAFLSFWNRLNETEQLNYLEKLSTGIYFVGSKHLKYGTDGYLKLILFLMNQMPETQRYDFVWNNFTRIISKFSSKTHFQKFCQPLVEHFLPKLVIIEKDILLGSCTDQFNTSARSNIDLEIIKRLFVDMRPTSRTFRGQLVARPEIEALQSIFESFHLPSLKSIINDENLQKYRNEIIGLGANKYKELMEKNNFQLLNEFMDQVLRSEEEKQKFENDYNFLSEWIEKGWFDIVDNILIWMHGTASSEFKIRLKNLYCSSIPKNFEYIEALLKWYLDANKNRQDKSELLNEFCGELIYNIWFGTNSRSSRIELSNKVLTFAFGTEDEISKFKTRYLAKDERAVKFFCENELKNDRESRFSIVDKFFNFCNLSEEKIEGIKKLISDNLQDWIEEYGVRPGLLRIIVPLLDWVYGEKEDNCSKLKNCFPDPDQVVSYYSKRK